MESMLEREVDGEGLLNIVVNEEGDGWVVNSEW